VKSDVGISKIPDEKKSTRMSPEVRKNLERGRKINTPKLQNPALPPRA